MKGTHMDTPSTHALPIAIIGAGPIGLVAAAHLVSRGETPLVLEAGGTVGASIRRWSHVRLFSPWKYLVDPVARTMLEEAGWTMPDPEQIPTGGELLDRFVAPLAALPQIAPHIHLNRKVVGVTRHGYDKVKSAGREQAPFELIVRTPGGCEERMLARAVIDASGTYQQPSPIGASGLPVEGETALAERIHYRIPDVFGGDRTRYAGKRTLVVGRGHSAFTSLLDLARLAGEAPGTEVVWAIRRYDVGLIFGGGTKDALPARGELGARLQQLIERGAITLVTGFRTSRLVRSERGILAHGGDAVIGPVDEIVVATGYRPDLSMTRELRLGLDSWLEAPVQLAPLIDPNLHSCGTVYPHGASELAHPEQNFYVVGMKSYGRAPTFLLLTGYEQVRSVVCALVGDEAGARAVELVLPETGVCSTDLGGSSCCAAKEPGKPAAIGGSCGITAPCTSSPAIDAVGTGTGCCA
ncbi:FAD-dependent oxidoreductase [soil metagenome]